MFHSLFVYLYYCIITNSFGSKFITGPSVNFTNYDLTGIDLSGSNITSANSDSSTISLNYNTGFTGGNIYVLGQTCYGLKTASISTTLKYFPPTLE